MDAVAGTVLALFLMMIMTAAVVKQAQRERELSDVRTAARAAEEAMLSVQAGQPLPEGTHAEAVDAPSIAGKRWVRITASRNGHSSTLLGLVDANTGAKLGGQQ